MLGLYNHKGTDLIPNSQPLSQLTMIGSIFFFFFFFAVKLQVGLR